MRLPSGPRGTRVIAALVLSILSRSRDLVVSGYLTPSPRRGRCMASPVQLALSRGKTFLLGTTEGGLFARPRERGGSPRRGDHDAWGERSVCRYLHGAHPSPVRNPSSDRAGYSRDPGRYLDRPHDEYRRQPAHRSGVLSALLRDFEFSLPRSRRR